MNWVYNEVKKQLFGVSSFSFNYIVVLMSASILSIHYRLSRELSFLAFPELHILLLRYRHTKRCPFSAALLCGMKFFFSLFLIILLHV